MVLLIIGLTVINKNIGKYVTADVVEVQKEVIVLDAGHGGDDPGKVGTNGVLEKDINLQIAKYVKKQGFCSMKIKNFNLINIF